VTGRTGEARFRAAAGIELPTDCEREVTGRTGEARFRMEKAPLLAPRTVQYDEASPYLRRTFIVLKTAPLSAKTGKAICGPNGGA
jgi:hypothetical protein